MCASGVVMALHSLLSQHLGSTGYTFNPCAVTLAQAAPPVKRIFCGLAQLKRNLARGSDPTSGGLAPMSRCGIGQNESASESCALARNHPQKGNGIIKLISRLFGGAEDRQPHILQQL